MSIILDEIAVQKNRQGVFFIDGSVLKLKRLPTHPAQTIIFQKPTPKITPKTKNPPENPGGGVFLKSGVTVFSYSYLFLVILIYSTKSSASNSVYVNISLAFSLKDK